MQRTLVAFHAHPDDEALFTAGSMARAVDEGHRVVLVLATAGEAGEAAGSFRGEAGDDLGAVHTREAEASAAALGVHRLVFLGYRDSGLGGDATAGSFTASPIDEAAGRLADVLTEEGADVVTSYDPNGGYGHPDHVRVHQVAARAAALAGTPRLLEATIDRDLLRLAAELAPTLGFDLPPDVVPPDLSDLFAGADEITHRIDVGAQLDRKRASMLAHTSQTTSRAGTLRTLEVFLSLPDDLFAAAFGTEYFVDRSATAGPVHHDLFADLG